MSAACRQNISEGDEKVKAKTDRRMKDMPEASDYGKRRLLTYADSFRELAKSLDGEFQCHSEDRELMLAARNQWENRQMLSENWHEIADVMTKVATRAVRFRTMEERKRRLIIHAMKQEGISVEDLFYIEKPGERFGICIAMSILKGGSKLSGEVADLLSIVLNKRLKMSVTSPYRVDEVKRQFILLEEPGYVVMTGTARAVRENEISSGDNYAFIEPECGKMTLLLSDGTGSGEKANEDSNKVLDLMEKLIEAEFDIDSAVHLVNNVVLAQGEEQNMSTLDICNLDLYEGSCEFYKVGAAASFVKREYLVEQIDAPCLPLGASPIMESEVVSCDLMDGDYIVMMTDGVLEALQQNHYEETMKRIIADMKERNPREMAECLLQFVLHCSGGRILDDMTIIVLGIWERSKPVGR